MLQSSRATAFTTFELLRDNQLGGGGTITPPLRAPPRLSSLIEKMLKPIEPCLTNYVKR